MGCFTLLAAAGEVAGGAAPTADDGALLLAALWSLSVPAWLFVVSRLLNRRAPLPYEGRRPLPGQGIDLLVAAFLWIVVQKIPPLILLRLQGFALPVDGKFPPEAVLPLLVDSCLSQFCATLIAIGWLALRTGASLENLGFGLRSWRRDLPAGLIAAALIVAPVLTLNAVLQHYWPSEHPLITWVRESPQALAVASILAVLLAPVSEEFMFRVVLQGGLEKLERRLRRRPDWPQSLRKIPAGALPIATSSAVFAAQHGGADPIPLFFFALVLGYLYHQTHRIWPSLVVHMALNGLTTVVLWTTMKG
jgi:membrane protease YdiL (CAAX protease family)